MHANGDTGQRNHPYCADKVQISFDEYLSIMNRVPLHEDPTEKLKNAFSIFDQYVCFCRDNVSLSSLHALADTFPITQGRHRQD